MYARISTLQAGGTTTNAIRSAVIVMRFSGTIYLGGGGGNLSGPIYEIDIADGAITTRKLAHQAVNTSKLANQCVTLEKLAPEVLKKLIDELGTNRYIIAAKDDKGYHVTDKIYASDFVVENPDGGSGGLGDLIIDDTITVGSKTWSSAKIRLELDNKSPINHQHSNYSLSGHSHSEYAAKVHLHTEYAAKVHLHPEYDAKQDLLPVRVTDGKLVVRDIIAMGDKF